MKQNRGQFSSGYGFVLAAAGSAVGLGNIWSFPSQAANNGGGAFVLVYLIMAFALAFPLLIAEMTVGRYSQANPVRAYPGLVSNSILKRVATSTGILAVVTASAILGFYSIVGGWLIKYTAIAISAESAPAVLTSDSQLVDILFCIVFLLLTAAIILRGVVNGIEKWTTRLMPCLLAIMVLLTIYLATQEGASQGFRSYLIPDFSQMNDVDLWLSAMGQAFFSLSLGVGTMLIYGSYLSSKESLPRLAGAVTLMDVGVAVLAGMLIVPAIFVAQQQGLEVYRADGQLIDGDGLVFNVLPALFKSLGDWGWVVSAAFFLLLTMAALTSSISMLEVPVSFLHETCRLSRAKANAICFVCIGSFSIIILLHFNILFSLIVSLSTQYAQPILGLLLAIFVGWLWSRDQLLNEIVRGAPNLSDTLFLRVWPYYVRFICPAAVIFVFAQQV